MIRILGFLKPIKKFVVISVFFMLLSQGMALLLPALMSLIVNNGIGNKDMDYIWRMGGLMIVGAVLGLVFSVFNAYYTSKLSTSYGKILREKVFMKVEGLSQCDIDKIGTSSLITRSTNDIQQLQIMLNMSMRMVAYSPILAIGRIIKVVRTESEEKFNYRGDHMGSEIKETISNKMIFNVLTPNGFKALT